MNLIKNFLIFLFSFISILIPCYANMAAPWIAGTSGSEIYASKRLDIIKEELNVKILNYHNAEFNVKYFIKSDSTYSKMLFIFDTMGRNYCNKACDFKIYFNNQDVDILNANLYYSDSIRHKWEIELKNTYPQQIDFPSEFYYFRMDIPKGQHTIHVTYTTVATINLSDRVKSYTFYYNLYPAQYWKSFGTLDLKIETNNIEGNITTDLPLNKSLLWRFDKIPQNNFSITIEPQLSKIVIFFLSIADYLPFFITFILIVIHLIAMFHYRKKNYAKIISPPFLIGSILIPVAFCFIVILSINFIDWIIGDHASQRHGYIFLIFLGIPIYIIIYSIVTLIFDFRFKISSKKEKGC